MSNNPDMTVRIAGLISPTVVIPRDAHVSIEFINADSDEAHALVVTAAKPPFAFHPAATPAFGGSVAGPIGGSHTRRPRRPQPRIYRTETRLLSIPLPDARTRVNDHARHAHRRVAK